ncbi:hypothetical protein PXH66_03290 [Synoicihabitans lomoniglobus]|uniref:Uncharacterized protein n=2 Tax=Synoicihabitans lomoniglobus TaxID=2909285 RepID=A0AAF0CPW5_9BACT|nr:hypothetical protein PXH66_03290 [Opitutaceae bacterium LMO-M01]
MRSVLRVILFCALGSAVGVLTRSCIYEGRNEQVTAVQSKPEQTPDSTEEPAPPSVTQTDIPTAKAPELWVRGYIVKGSHVNVLLSDGRTITERDGELDDVGNVIRPFLERVERNFVELRDLGRVWIGPPRSRNQVSTGGENFSSSENKIAGISTTAEPKTVN